jgi:hypothetical protein
MPKRFLSVVRGYGRGELDEGVLVIQKDAGQDTFDVWVAVVDHGGAESLTAEVSIAREGEPDQHLQVPLTRYQLDDGRVRGVPANARFFYQHATVTGLVADTSYHVTVEVEGRGRAGCIARTLPSSLSPRRALRVFAGSCYDFGTDPEDRMDKAYKRIFADHPADLTLLVGDQVYADAPTVRYMLHSQRNPRADLLLKYWTTWGMSRPKPLAAWQRVLLRQPQPARRSGLRAVLGAGPNYFLPDDHEFWNNWPNQAVTARHSYAAILRGRREARRRRKAVLADHQTLPPAPPPRNGEPQYPPATPLEQNYLPVHPAERERWSLASFELFEAFQTRSRADRIGLPTRGAADTHFVGPPDDTPAETHPPRNEILQIVRVDPITVCLLDTRTRRTRRLRHPRYSGFVDEHYLAAVIEHARTADIFLLATPQPLLSRASWPKTHLQPEHSSAFDDVNMWDYWHQWQQLWTELIAARNGRPTVTIGGDIHQSYIAFAPELSLVEIVSSPMSLVWGGGIMQLAARITSAAQLALRIPGDQLDYQAGTGFIGLPEVITGPDEAPAAPHASAVATGCLKKDEEGFARLTFEQTAADTVTLTAELFRRDEVADRGVTTAAVTGRYAMRLGTSEAGEPTIVDL